MARVLVTGMSGTGKTTVLDELRRRGHVTLDTDPHGATPEQRAEIERNVGAVEPLLRRGASVEFDARRPVSELADLIEALVDRSP